MVIGVGGCLGYFRLCNMARCLLLGSRSNNSLLCHHPKRWRLHPRIAVVEASRVGVTD